MAYLIGFFLFAVVANILQKIKARRAARQQEADHRRYQVFQQQREADRTLIYQQVQDEAQAFERERERKQQARDERRRLVPDWAHVLLLRQQERISESEFWAYCLDNTGEYCPALSVN